MNDEAKKASQAAPLLDIDVSAAQKLAEITADSDQLGMPAESWAHWLAWEFCFLNEQPGHWAGRAQAEVQYMRTFEANRGSLPLRQVPSCVPWPKNLELPPKWDTGLTMLKGELRTWAAKHCPDLLGRLLANQSQPESMPALETTNAEMLDRINADIKARMGYRMDKVPAPLYGEGFSEEMQKVTTLTKYLELETWTPIEAAMLVCGLKPLKDCHEIPQGAFGLDNALVMPNEDRLHHAKRVLQLWNSRENPSDKIRPADFVAWCKTKGINTDWLRDIEAAAMPQPESAPEGIAFNAPKEQNLREDEQTEQEQEVYPVEAGFAELFPPVAHTALESMFPAGGKWASWAERASRNDLKLARRERGLFNPYLASQWWLTRKKPKGWDSEKCLRVLVRNFPNETQDHHDLLYPGTR